MGLDIRWPIGLMFSLVGALVTLYGLFFCDPAQYQRSLGININVDWGLVLLAFGLGMLGLAWRAKGRTPPTDGPPKP